MDQTIAADLDDALTAARDDVLAIGDPVERYREAVAFAARLQSAAAEAVNRAAPVPGGAAPAS